MSEIPSPCECPLAGWCERHHMTKSHRRHELCQQREDYRAKWDREAESRKTGKPRLAEPKQNGLHCLYIGSQLREEECEGCKGTVRVKVYACSKLGETTLKGCQRCGEFTSPE